MSHGAQDKQETHPNNRQFPAHRLLHQGFPSIKSTAAVQNVHIKVSLLSALNVTIVATLCIRNCHISRKNFAVEVVIFCINDTLICTVTFCTITL